MSYQGSKMLFLEERRQVMNPEDQRYDSYKCNLLGGKKIKGQLLKTYDSLLALVNLNLIDCMISD